MSKILKNDCADGRLFIACPYQMKDIAKKYGAKFCMKECLWFIPMYTPKNKVDKIYSINGVMVYKMYGLKQSYNGRKGFEPMSRKQVLELFEDKDEIQIKPVQENKPIDVSPISLPQCSATQIKSSGFNVCMFRKKRVPQGWGNVTKSLNKTPKV